VSRVVDDFGNAVEVGKFTLNGGLIVEISDVDLNSAGTGTVQYVTVQYGDEVERYPAVPSYSLPDGVARCAQVCMA